jgi:site-specific DNA recombinase
VSGYLAPGFAQQVADIYLRVSDPKQERLGTSLETQEDAARAWCAERGIAVRHVFRETFSGVELWDRPQMTACREKIRRDPPDYLIVHALDRLAREPDHQAVIMSEAEYHGVEVVFVTETFDKTPQGKLLRDVAAFGAKVEHLKIQERTQRGLRARIEAGKPLPGARVLYGYRWNEARTAYLIDPVTGPVVERVYREMLAGRTLRAIARGLTDDGIPTPKGGETWVYTVVSKILANPRYRGEAVANRYKSTKTKGATTRGRQRRVVSIRPEAEQTKLPEGTIPALVSAEAASAVGERLTLNKARSARNNRDPESALLRGGYVRCGYCQRVMSAVPLANGQRIYRCAGASESKCYHGISTHLLDAAVWGRIEAALTEPERVLAEVEKVADADPAGPDLAAVDRAHHEAEAELAQLALQLGQVKNATAIAMVAARMDELGERIETLAGRRAEVLAHHETRLAASDQARLFVDWCARVAGNLRVLDYGQKRLALDALGVQITVYRADHAPRWTMTASIPLEAGGEEIVYPMAGRSVHNITLCWSSDDARPRLAS